MSFDFSQQKDPLGKKGTVLESASKRVRMIFSVMASPNRIDILRILNVKGPLTYSELKALAGFKSKKESGKFAYHLRKLLRQSLVSLNKAERRYTITNLGKLVLSLARQIEERSIVEGGKMYVRTSRHSIEEFNSHKIIQSLVREGNLPLELAHKITEEVENRIYKFQTNYLTSSLIRETVNSVLIEHGHEEQRNRLARLGPPPADLAEMFSSEDDTRNGIESIMSKAAGSIFSEHLVFGMLPKDIADMHLAGEINISPTGSWNLVPDSIFLDLSEFQDGIDLKGKFLNVSRLPAFKTLDDVIAALPVLVSLLSREASSEIVLNGMASILSKGTKDSEDIASKFAKALTGSSAAPAWHGSAPLVTFAISTEDLDSKQLNVLLDGYRKYADSTPMPRISLALVHNGEISPILDHVSAAVRSGGIVSVCDRHLRSSNGIKKVVKTPSAISLHSLSINLPRLAYESNKDETYFRAKLALTIKPALAALGMRKKTIMENVKKGLLPTIGACTQSLQRGAATVSINLTGLQESVYGILGYEGASGTDVTHKILKTAGEVASSQGRAAGIETASIAMVLDNSASRFASMDADKYGKIPSLQSSGSPRYSQGLIISSKELLSTPAGGKALIHECTAMDKLLNGGLAIGLELGETPSEINSAVGAGSELPFFRPQIRLLVCSICGRRGTAAGDRCEYCKSPRVATAPSLY